MSDALLNDLRAGGLALPGAHLKSPWPGHLDLAVKDKTFAYLSKDGEPLSISVKLARSHEVAMLLPGAKPTAYGLGKSGWVTLTFDDGGVPGDLLREWILESYRLQAPKKLVALLDAGAASTAHTKKVPAKKEPAKKAPAKKVPAKKVPAKKEPAKKEPTKKAPATASIKKAPTKTASVKRAPTKKAAAKK